MTVSHTRVVAFSLAISVFINCILASESSGEGSGVVTLSAPQKLKPDGRSEAKNSLKVNSYKGYRPQAKVGSASEVQVNPLDEIDISALGLIGEEDGGFSPYLWKGSRLSFIKRLLEHRALQGRSVVMRQLLRRLLITEAMPPKGSKGSGFIVMRVNALMKIGDFDAGLKLLSIIPQKNRGSLLRKLEMKLHLVNGNTVEACAMAASEVTNQPDSFWQKTLVYCELLKGEVSRAELGLSLLEEEDLGDPTFLALAQGIINDQPILPKVITRLDILNLAMLKLAKLKVPLPLARRNPAALLTATLDAAPLPRLDAIEIAAENGLLGSVDLRERYKTALLTSVSVNDLKGEAVSALDRAQLFLEAMETNIPMARAEALERVMGSARDASRIGGVARLFRPVIQSLVPENDLLWVAPVAFRSALLSGLSESAASWFGLARRNAAFSPDASAIFQSLELLGAIMQRNVTITPDLISMDKLTSDQRILYLSLFEALGGELDEEDIEPLAYKTKSHYTMPDPVLWQKLSRLNRLKEKRIIATGSENAISNSQATIISSNGSTKELIGSSVSKKALMPPLELDGHNIEPDRVGERILVMLSLMGDESLRDMSPLIASEIIHGLLKAGLKAEAHGFAMEVAINAGL